MLRVLLVKDLRRMWRNPLPWLINIIIPLSITALIGLAFGGSDQGLGRVKFAFVNEDQMVLSDLLRGAVSWRENSEHVEPVYLDRATALRQINDNQISAVIVIRTNFIRDYFAGRDVSLELIKNPAQSIQPTVIEEALGALVTGMNAVSRNFKAAFPRWQAAFEGEVDFHTLTTSIDHRGTRFEAVKKYISPPLVGYEKEAHNNGPEAESKSETVQPIAQEEKVLHDNGNQNPKADTTFVSVTEKKMSARPKARPNSDMAGIFSWVLVGMSAMFLLFLASNAMTDLQRELRYRTFERYQTLRERLLPFVGGKVVFAVVFLVLCSVVMLGGGGLVFRIQWLQPLALVTLTLAYACFAAGLMAVLVAWSPDERHSGTLNSIVVMILGMAGGCLFPERQLPAFIREHITPQLPTHWFADTVRNLQDGAANVPWIFVSLKLIGLSTVLVTLAVMLFQRRFKSGLKT